MPTRAAIEEGVVAGGGVALVRASQAIDNLKLSEEEKFGANIIKRACEAPIRQIASNAGLDGAIVLDRTLREGKTNENYGLNALTGQYTDLIKDGVIDSKKVVRCALEYACSVASLMLTTEAMIVEEPKTNDTPTPQMPSGMGGMGGMGGMPMM